MFLIREARIHGSPQAEHPADSLEPEHDTLPNLSLRPWETIGSHPCQSLPGHQELQEGDSLV